MNKIIKKDQFSEKVFCLEVEAPLIAHSCKAGQFIILRVDKHSERVPYTIAKADDEKGTLTLVVQEVGLSSTKLCNLNEGDYVQDLSVRWVMRQKSRSLEQWFAPEVASVSLPSCPSLQRFTTLETG